MKAKPVSKFIFNIEKKITLKIYIKYNKIHTVIYPESNCYAMNSTFIQMFSETLENL